MLVRRSNVNDALFGALDSGFARLVLIVRNRYRPIVVELLGQ